LLAITRKIENKGSQMGHTKKKYLKKSTIEIVRRWLLTSKSVSSISYVKWRTMVDVQVYLSTVEAA
jgi:hypothetical protein